MARAPNCGRRMIAGAPFRVLLFGWHGARYRHLRAIGRHYEALGGEPQIALTRTFDAMSRPDGWEREGRALAAQIEAEERRASRALVLHAFSNAGFWLARATLDALAAELRARHRATVLDSAPGFPERIGPLLTARYATRAMLPGLLAALGLPPAHRHPVLGWPVAAFFGLWHLVAPVQVRFMEQSLARMCEHHAGVPLLLVWGGADELVPPRHVERFAEAAERGGVPLERLYFPDSPHVGHLVHHRAEYLATLERFLEAALAAPARAPRV